MSKSPPTQTRTEQTSQQVPQYVQDAQRNLLTTGQSLAAPFTANAPAFGVAGFTPDQEMGFDLARQTAQNAYTTPPFMAPTANTTPSTVSAQFNDMAPAERAQFTAGQAAQLGAGDIAQFMNPYTKDVIDTTLGDMTKKFGETSAAARARLAAGGAFGGSRQAVMENGMARDFGDTVARTAAGLRHQGFTTAADLGRSNAQMRQQTGTQNTQLENQLATWNAGAGNARNAANTEAANRFALANAAAANATLESRANRDLQAATLDNSFANDAQARQLGALRSLLGVGALQQGTTQQALNQPLDWLKVLGQITPGNTGSSGTTVTTSPSNAPSMGQQLLGGGLSLLGLGTGGGATLGGSLLSGLFSDEDEKTNKQKLGKDRETGLDIYAYDYKADVEAAKKSGRPMPPKRVGPMAQDIERAHPGSTASVGGKRVVKPSALRAMIGA